VSAAATTDTSAPVPASNQSVPLAGTVNCFDYYHFGSAQADISTNLASTVSGATLGFTGTLSNDNSYPLVDTSVYVKIFRKQTNETVWHQNGHILVDQFFAAEHIDLSAKGQKPFTFTWKVPSYALSGDYFATTYVVTQKKFNFLGLTFTNDVNGNVANFSVIGEQTTSVSIDPNTLMVGNEKSSPVQPAVSTDATTPVILGANVINTTTQVQIVPVTWTVYHWDGVGEGNQIDQRTEKISLNPKETKHVTYTVADTKYPVYFSTLKVVYQDTSSIVSLRFARDGIDRTRINFPAVTSYPLEAGKTATLFSCLHNTSNSASVQNGKLNLTVTDSSGTVIDSYEYTGDVTGAMMGVKHDFTPKETLGTFDVNAKLYQDGKLVDESTMHYDCTTLGGVCPPASATTFLKTISSKTLLLTLLLLTIMLGLIWRIVRSKKSSQRLRVWFLALLVGVAWLVTGTGVQAASVVVKGSDIRDSVDIDGSGGYCSASRTLITATSSVTYTANATINNSPAPAVFPVGTTVVFTPKLGDISWFASGNNFDSPYGFWKANAGMLRFQQSVMLWVGCSGGQNSGTLTGLLSVNPATFTFTHTGSTASLDCSVAKGKETCTITSAGSVMTQVHFSNTYGKLYTFNRRSETPTTPPSLNTVYSAAEIGLSFIASNPNNPPVAPVVTDTNTIDSQHGQGSINDPFTISAVSTDPEEDMLRYGFDWNIDGAVDEWVPVSGYVASGRSSSLSHTWTTEGTKLFQVLAQDKNGGSSGFTQHTITIAQKIKICQNACNSGFAPVIPVGQTTGTISNLTSPVKLVACANSDAACGNSANTLTNSTVTWSVINNPSGKVTVNPTNSVSTTVSQNTGGKADSATVHIAFPSTTYAPRDINAVVPCTPNCKFDSDPSTKCQDVVIHGTDLNHCGGSCQATGTKACDSNWNEVAP